jgi:hypothetical protein
MSYVLKGLRLRLYERDDDVHIVVPDSAQKFLHLDQAILGLEAGIFQRHKSPATAATNGT